MRYLSVFALFIFAVTANAGTVTIDFEDVTPPEFGGSDPFKTNGFLITPKANGYDIFDETFTDGQALGFGPFTNAGFTIETVGGQVLSLSSFDIGFAFGDIKPFVIEGYQSGGIVISQNFDSVGGTFFDTVIMGPGWENLDSISFTMTALDPTPVVFDNIVVSAVPVPAAVWLFGSALAGLGWLRRKQTV
jgi:hypothetical protein